MPIKPKGQLYFFNYREFFKSDLKEKELLLFLDYDGTLAAIAATPQEAFLPPETRETLDALSRDSTCRVVIVTGRALADVRKRIGLKKVTYIGNHGFEIHGPDTHFQNNCFPRVRDVFRKLFSEFDKKFRDLPGVILEDKGMTLSVHYRQVEEKRQPLFERRFHAIVSPFVEQNEIKVYKGKKVYEVRPPVEWDKGKVVLWMLKEYQTMMGNKKTVTVYIGDDETDEDAFRALSEKAITVRVGHSTSSKAQYYLEDTHQVAEFLKAVLVIKREEKKST